MPQTPTDALRLVPTKATPQMIAAMDKNICGYKMGLGSDFLHGVWSAALAAAPASPLPGGGWQDISTAPQDGTAVLVAPHMAVVSWDFGAERWIVGVIPLNDDRTIADDWTVQPVMFFEQYLSNWGVEPTHWMPLPAAPTGEPQ